MAQHKLFNGFVDSPILLKQTGTFQDLYRITKRVSDYNVRIIPAFHNQIKIKELIKVKISKLRVI